MEKEKGPIATMTALLILMANDYGTRKTSATLFRSRFPSAPAKGITIKEYFDDGKGHSGAFTNRVTPVTLDVFEKACAEKYISGQLEPGYVSDWKFSITDLGRRAYVEQKSLADRALNLLYEGKGMRVCDLQPGLRVSEELIADVLEWLVYEGHAESYEHGEQKFYLCTH